MASCKLGEEKPADVITTTLVHFINYEVDFIEIF